MGRLLSAAAIDRLKNYKYHSSMTGWLDNTIMTPFWNSAINLLPLYLAPNLITLLGLLCPVVAVCVLGAYQYQYQYQSLSSSSLSYAPPGWSFCLAALLMFLYQTLDALDGKQARRTKSSSPLGQLFDHGCDALCAVLDGVLMAMSIQSGVSVLTAVIVVLHMAPFYISNWECTYTDVMRFGAIGVTEAQFGEMAIMLTSGLFGPEVWLHRVFGVELRVLVTATCAAIVVWQAIIGMSNVHRVCNERRAQGVSERIAWAQLAQVSTAIACVLIVLRDPSSSSSPFWNNALDFGTVIAAAGLLFGFLVTQLIVCHVTGMAFDALPAILWPLPVLVLHYTLNLLPFPLVWTMRLYLLWVACCYGMYVHGIIAEICAALHINCFTIPYPPPTDRVDSAHSKMN